jgi:hypothetical protein
MSFLRRSKSTKPAGDAAAVPGGGAAQQDNKAAAESGTAAAAAAAPGAGARQEGGGTRKLRVRVVKGADLVAKDRGGTSDPLAQLVLGTQTRETQVVPKTLNPEWNESFTLQFTPGGGQQMDVVL